MRHQGPGLPAGILAFGDVGRLNFKGNPELGKQGATAGRCRCKDERGWHDPYRIEMRGEEFVASQTQAG